MYVGSIGLALFTIMCGQDVESQDLTMALVTEMVPPVPEPPQNEHLDIVKWRLINSQSQLFHITTPVNVNLLHELLMTHPNWPLIDSICKGLKNGFWPWAVTHELS